MDVADEGDTPLTSPREGSDHHHPPAREAQCRLQVSVPMEGNEEKAGKAYCQDTIQDTLQ